MSYSALFSHPRYVEAKRIVLFCNQSSYDFNSCTYLFDLINKDKKLHRILIPEHGLFSEYQDQKNIDNQTYKNIPCVSLYNKLTGITGPEKWMFEDADLLLIDVQDVGVRFFTYTTHMFSLLKYVGLTIQNLAVILIDRPNPIGTKTEGTIINPAYTSFLGINGMIHRHGMSTGNLCRWFISQNNMKLNIFMVKYFVDPNHFISPSPNLPSNLSLVVYPGQCFWEATSFSEGRGTTRPFELFGHPNLTFDLAEQISYLFNKKYEGLAYLRPTYFIPVCHKHANTTCCGWQIFVKNKDHYHTLHGTLDMMKWVKKMGPGIDFWRVGKYEFDSDATAAQLLIGDDDLIAYVEGETKESYLLQKLHDAQSDWHKKQISIDENL